jgi:predicted DNA-binding antitoxin AbrB/MazE fold protein
MERSITAVFEDGVLKPVVPLELPPHALVHLTLESWEGTPEIGDPAWEELERCWDEIEVDSVEPRPTRDDLHDRY